VEFGSEFNVFFYKDNYTINLMFSTSL